MTVTSFPTWVYHRTEPPRILATREDFEKLQNPDQWADTPAAFYEPEKPALKRGKAKE